MTAILRLGIAATAAWGLLHGQAFDAASIKQSAAGQRGYSIQPLPGRLSVKNATLKQLVAAAYHVHDYQIAGGPKWLSEDAYDAEAKAPDAGRPPTEKELMAMLQKLLEQRFKLTVRRESKDLPMYLLQPAKAGPKVQQTKDTSVAVVFRVFQRRQITSVNATLDNLTESLAWILGRPVVDQTGLTGPFDYKLEWAPDDLQLRSDETPISSDGTVPSLGAALQEQMGLRLTQQRGPVEIINIEHAEKASQN